MKIRTGFVSNSSSSSFVVPKNAFNSVFDLGREMLRIRNEDWNQVEEDRLQAEIRKLNRAEELGINPNMSITFATTNYDTYIRKDHNGNYQVDTCNNQDWSSIPQSEYSEDDLIPKYELFWWVKEGVLGKKLRVNDPVWEQFRKDNNIKDPYPICNMNLGHYTDMVETEDRKVICVECYEMGKHPDMILSPVKIPKKPEYIIKPRLRLR